MYFLIFLFKRSPRDTEEGHISVTQPQKSKINEAFRQEKVNKSATISLSMRICLPLHKHCSSQWGHQSNQDLHGTCMSNEHAFVCC